MNPRVFVSESNLSIGECLRVTGDDGHHLSRVLRVQPAELVAVGAGGRGYLGKVDSVDAKAGSVSVTVTEMLPSHESPVSVYLVQGLPKADKTESILKHTTELGTAGFCLFQSSRSVARLDGKDAKKQRGKLERWERVIREAAGQSQRDLLPTLRYAGNWDELLSWVKEVAPGLILLLDEDEEERALSEVLSSYAEHITKESAELIRTGASVAKEVSPVVLCVGPEGGWDAQERQSFRTDLGAIPVTLGPRILRTETAGLVGAAAVLYHFRALGG